jgi:alcohol dehydrogenase class IV
MNPNSSSLLSFQHVAAELRIMNGEDSLAALARELKRNGCSRAVVVTGRSVSASPAMALLREVLGPVLVAECTTVRPNSPVPDVEQTARVLKDAAADAVIAIGGGSAAVTARAAGILLAEGRPAQDLCTRRSPSGEFESPRLGAAKLPQFVVPTTPSTAFVKAGSAVHDPLTGQRLALYDPKTRAKAIFLHPAFLRTSPSELVLSATLNTLSTALEALESPKCDPVSEAMLTQAVRLIVRHLDRESLDGIVARDELAIAAVLCGRGTEQAGGGLASVLAHAIGHGCKAANGLVNAIVLPHTMRFNLPVTAPYTPRIADALRARTPDGMSRPGDATQVIAALDALFAKLSIPRSLRDIGVPREQLAHIAEAAMSDWFIGRAPRRVSGARDLLAILDAAW